MPIESVDFAQCNKMLIKGAVSLCWECWKYRCAALHSPEVRIQQLKKGIKSINEEAISGSIVNYDKYVN